MGSDPTATPLLSPTPSPTPVPVPDTGQLSDVVDKLTLLLEANLWMLAILTVILVVLIVTLFFTARGESH